MSMNLKKKSISLVALMFLSTMLALVSVPATSAAGINQTTSGVLNGQETWTGTHNLVGNVTVAPGASLVVNPGTRLTYHLANILMFKERYVLRLQRVVLLQMALHLAKLSFLGVYQLIIQFAAPA